MRDRISTRLVEVPGRPGVYAIRYAEYSETGQFIAHHYYVPDDEPTDDGTLIGKVSLLSDPVSFRIFGDRDDHTVDEALDRANMPIGAIMAYPSTVTPENFLPCDGSEVSAAAYPGLCAVLGDTYGIMDTFAAGDAPTAQATAGDISPDGSQMVLAFGNTLNIYNVSALPYTKNPALTPTALPASNPTTVKYSPDGRLVAVFWNNMVRIYDTTTTPWMQKYTYSNTYVSYLSWRPDSNRLLFRALYEYESSNWRYYSMLVNTTLPTFTASDVSLSLSTTAPVCGYNADATRLFLSVTTSYSTITNCYVYAVAGDTYTLLGSVPKTYSYVVMDPYGFTADGMSLMVSTREWVSQGGAIAVDAIKMIDVSNSALATVKTYNQLPSLPASGSVVFYDDVKKELTVLHYIGNVIYDVGATAITPKYAVTITAATRVFRTSCLTVRHLAITSTAPYALIVKAAAIPWVNEIAGSKLPDFRGYSLMGLPTGATLTGIAQNGSQINASYKTVKHVVFYIRY